MSEKKDTWLKGSEGEVVEGDGGRAREGVQSALYRDNDLLRGNPLISRLQLRAVRKYLPHRNTL